MVYMCFISFLFVYMCFSTLVLLAPPRPSCACPYLGEPSLPVSVFRHGWPDICDITLRDAVEYQSLDETASRIQSNHTLRESVSYSAVEPCSTRRIFLDTACRYTRPHRNRCMSCPSMYREAFVTREVAVQTHMVHQEDTDDSVEG